MTDHLDEAEEHLKFHRRFGGKQLADAVGCLIAHLRATAPAREEQPGERIDPRPSCIRCGKRWTPGEGDDATVRPCVQCQPVTDEYDKPGEAEGEPSDDAPDEQECPHGDQCCQNEPCIGPGNPDIDEILTEYRAGSPSHRDGLCDVWNLGKAHGYEAGVSTAAAERASLKAELAQKARELEELRAKVAARDARVVELRGVLRSVELEIRDVANRCDGKSADASNLARGGALSSILGLVAEHLRPEKA